GGHRDGPSLRRRLTLGRGKRWPDGPGDGRGRRRGGASGHELHSALPGAGPGERPGGRAGGPLPRTPGEPAPAPIPRSVTATFHGSVTRRRDFVSRRFVICLRHSPALYRTKVLLSTPPRPPTVFRGEAEMEIFALLAIAVQIVVVA